MRTAFSKRLVASGLIAALGANLLATSPAFADSDRRGTYRHGNDRHMESRRGHDRHDWNRPRGHSRGHRDRGDDRWHGRKAERGPSRDRRHAVKIIEKSKIMHREGRRRGPVVNIIDRPTIIHHGIARHPVVRVMERPVILRREFAHDGPRRFGRHHSRGLHYGPAARVIVVPERRRYRNVWVVRHYGHRYHGYGHYRHDRDAYQWLAFTAIGVALIGALSETQQRTYEDAQIRAASAPIGQTIYWKDAGAAGSVTATREGTSSLNRYCREFQQVVTVGGKTEQAYGTACRQPDGAWKIVPQPSF